MRVVFKRTHERGYAVDVRLDDGARVQMNPAPGFDPFMPHDLLHLIVESELAIDNGIFGQLQQRGGAGTFRAAARRPGRDARRQRRRAARRDRQLLRAGRDEAQQSERATWIALQAWLAGSAEPELRARAAQPGEVAAYRAAVPDVEANQLSDAALRGIRARMDELSRRWRDVAVGQSMSVDWPLGRR